jgi:hypothetical protein
MNVKKPLFALLAASALGSMAIPAQSQVIVGIRHAGLPLHGSAG